MASALFINAASGDRKDTAFWTESKGATSAPTEGLSDVATHQLVWTLNGVPSKQVVWRFTTEAFLDAALVSITQARAAAAGDGPFAWSMAATGALTAIASA